MQAKRAAIYTRVSTGRQEREETIETQVRAAQAWLASNSYREVAVYRDQAVSGTVPMAKRDDGHRLLMDAHAGKFETMAVYRLDRIGRSRDTFWPVLERLAGTNVGVRSINEDLNTDTPDGRFMLAIRIEFAAFERELTMQRTKDGQMDAARRGAFLGGPTPYGFRVIGHKPRYLESAEEFIPDYPQFCEAEIIRLVYHLSGMEQWSSPRIARELNAMGVPTAIRSAGEGQSRKNWKPEAVTGRWSASRIVALIREPRYRGAHPYGRLCPGSPQRHADPEAIIWRDGAAIVTPELWQMANDNLTARRIYDGHGAKNPYLLRGLVHCGACGRPWTGITSTVGLRPRYYRCRGRHRVSPDLYEEPNTPRCTMHSVRCKTLEADLWECLREHFDHEEDTLAQIRGAITADEHRAEHLVLQRDGVLANLEKGKRRISSFQDQIADGDMTREEGREKIAHAREALAAEESRVNEINAAIDAIQNQQTHLGHIGRMLRTWSARVQRPMTDEERRQIVERVVERVEVYPMTEGLVRFHYRLRFDDRVTESLTPKRSCFSYVLEVSRPLAKVA